MIPYWVQLFYLIKILIWAKKSHKILKRVQTSFVKLLTDFYKPVLFSSRNDNFLNRFNILKIEYLVLGGSEIIFSFWNKVLVNEGLGPVFDFDDELGAFCEKELFGEILVWVLGLGSFGGMGKWGVFFGSEDFLGFLGLGFECLEFSLVNVKRSSNFTVLRGRWIFQNFDVLNSRRNFLSLLLQ